MQLDIDLSTEPATVALADSDDFKGFKVVARGAGAGDDALARAIQQVGRLAEDDEHAFVDLDALKRLAGPRGTDPGWLEQLDGMVGYARSKGWTDDAGGVRAHIERTPSAG